MSDIYIFLFGLAVSILVGTGLCTMIIWNNRIVDAAESEERPEDHENASTDSRPGELAHRAK